MSDSRSEAYAAAGVDVTAGYESVKRIKKHVESTFIPGVLSGLGGFGGLYKPDLTGIKNPVFVSGADGVGTKLKVAMELNKHDTIGIDAVAMCVNDIICSGAKPLFFLDYIAQGKVFPEKVEQIVKGVAEGCRQAGCALIGGETAEHPGMMPDDEYDIAGFAVGIVDEEKILDATQVHAGDAVIGLLSSGVHSNGFSLIRKIFDERYNEYIEALGATIGETLLTPTRIYTRIFEIDNISSWIVSACHITGGGWYENMPRMLPDGMGLSIDKSKVPLPSIFELIQREGGVSERDMYNTYNMGVGMALVVPPEAADRVAAELCDAGIPAVVIGKCVANGGEIDIW